MNPDALLSSDAAENELADLVDEITERMNAGEDVALQDYTAGRPHLAKPLAELWDALALIHAPGVAEREPLSPLAAHEPLGDFQLIREVGRGGMGVVYEAEQLSLGRRVALKVLPLAATLSPQQLQRFKNEARAAATLKHPHIVGVYQVGVERGVHYYAMELVDGCSLAEAIAQVGSARQAEPERTPAPDSESPARQAGLTAETSPVAALSTVRTTDPREYYRQAARLIAEAAEALDYAHNRGVVHRDIKPGNLLIDTQSQVHVTDFGLARLEADAATTLTGDILGTLRYMSPEQAAGKPALVDYRTDIHALGATLYELVALQPAFAGDDRGELLREVIETTPRALRQVDAAIPADLETIVAKALEKQPADRYQSASELAADLRAFVDDRPIVARPPSLVSRTHRWTRKHAAAVTVGFVVMLLATFGMTIAAAMIGHQRTTAVANAEQSEENLQLALQALDETLAESVAGNLVAEYDDPKRRELERRGIAFYEEFARRNDLDPNSWPTYRLLACNASLSRAVGLQRSDADSAETEFMSTLRAAELLVDQSPVDPRCQATLINCLNSYAHFLSETSRLERSLELSARGEALADRLCTNHGDFAPAYYLLGVNRYNEGLAHFQAGRHIDAARCYDEATAPLATALSREQNELRNPLALARCHYNLALTLALSGEPREADQHWRQSLELWNKLLLMNATISEFHSQKGATLSNLAVLARAQGDFEKCRSLAQEAIECQLRARSIEPVYVDADGSLAKHFRQLSLALVKLGDHAAVAEIAEQRIAEFPDKPEQWCAAAMSLAECAVIGAEDNSLPDKQRLAECDRHAERSLALLDQARARFADRDEALHKLVSAYSAVGEKMVASHPADARRAWETLDGLLHALRGRLGGEQLDETDGLIQFNRKRLTEMTR